MATSNSTKALFALPNEILLDVFLCLRTPDLLPLTLVCHRFHDLIVRIIQTRLTQAASLAGRSVVLECYPPSRRLYETYMLADYLRTDGLDPSSSALDDQGRAAGESLVRFNNLYSRFQPYRRVLQKKVIWRHPAGDIPGSRTYRPFTATNAIPTMMSGSSFSSPLLDSVDSDEEQELETSSISTPTPPAPSTPQTEPSTSDAPESSTDAAPPPELPVYEPVKTQIHLDADDDFTQLCANVDLAIPGPKHGIYHGFQKVNKPGVLRVWRRWLAERASASESSSPCAPPSDPGILWINNTHHVGIRFTVQQRRRIRAQQAPVLTKADDADDGPVTYELRYDELLVRTRDLLLASEELRDQEFRENGKAIVIGTWI